MLCDTLDTRPYAPHDTRPSTLTRLPHLPPHQVELEIGGQKIDKITSDWLRLYSEVYHSSDEKAGYRRLVDFDNPAAGGDAGVEKRFFVPINFFFTRYVMRYARHSSIRPTRYSTVNAHSSPPSPTAPGPRPWRSRLWPSSTTRSA